MAVHYETQFTNVGGRVGESVAIDNTFKLDQPGEDGKMAPGATNPEQLFAASLASCYNGAFLYHMEAPVKKAMLNLLSPFTWKMTRTMKAPCAFVRFARLTLPS